MVPNHQSVIISYDEKSPWSPSFSCASIGGRPSIHLCLAQFASQGFDGGSGIHTSEEHVWREIQKETMLQGKAQICLVYSMISKPSFDINFLQYSMLSFYIILLLSAIDFQSFVPIHPQPLLCWWKLMESPLDHHEITATSLKLAMFMLKSN